MAPIEARTPAESECSGLGQDSDNHHVQEAADKLYATNPNNAASARHIWALGMMMVIGGQCFGWNPALQAGLGSFAVAVLLTGSMFLCLNLCLAEMNSALPFSGGAYGFARVTLGAYAGFLVGCCESVEYITSVALPVLAMGQMITSLTDWHVNLEPIYWIVFYVIALSIHIFSGRRLWSLCLFSAVLIVFILLLFCVGCTPWMNFQKYAALDSNDRNGQWFSGGWNSFMGSLPVTAWLYVGIETLPLTSEETFEPRRTVPVAMVVSILTLLVTSIGVLFCTVSLPPGTNGLASALYPLNYGFALMFGANVELMSLLSLPAVIATAFAFMFAYGRQMYAMARSGLFPSFMTGMVANRPYMSLCVGSCLSFIVCICGWTWKEFDAIIYPLCMIGAYCAYISQFLSFIFLRLHYPKLKRQFKSPFSINGAVYGLLVAFISLCAALGYQQFRYQATLATVICVLLASFYYWVSARHTQRFSPEEQSVMFVAYVIKDNLMKIKSRARPQSLRNLSKQRQSIEMHTPTSNPLIRASVSGPVDSDRCSSTLNLTTDDSPHANQRPLTPTLTATGGGTGTEAYV